MLKYNFDRVFRARGIAKPFAFLKRVGFSDSFSSKVKNNHVARLNLKTIEHLCISLHCTPNDLMEWSPDPDFEVSADHPINAIRRSDKLIDIAKALHNIPINKLDEVEELIKKHVDDNYNKQVLKNV
jgi:DNA-binding Xre family transcriptional regulator